MLAGLELYDLIHYIKPLVVKLNGKTVSIVDESVIYKNGMKAKASSAVKSGDTIVINSSLQQPFTVQNLLTQEEIPFVQSITVNFNGMPVLISRPLVEVKRGVEQLNLQSPIHSGDTLTVTMKQKHPFIFQDIFRFIDYNFTAQENKTIKILQNETNATFSTPIHTGDHLEIKWVEKVKS
ncbi:hypothetical protein [Anaerobacillus sp. CMMVII]|uniref:hypothetical protein n=1 Tax=Anaerobacillus sp. CMMVII TaxID=2755588 RepID=UPI0028E0A2A7|nr:hypothetical protein [Anaerobacillus sp. CMMVII]